MAAKVNNGMMFFNKNELGNDYVVGDIHGEFNRLESCLNNLSFNDNDRLFCVGDLIDRGSNNEKVYEFLLRKNVFSVRGNHEDNLLSIYEDVEIRDYMFSSDMGLDWWLSINLDKRAAIINKLKGLPIAIEIENDEKKYGIIHADTAYNDWNIIKKILSEEENLKRDAVINYSIWSRNRVEQNVSDFVNNIDIVYVGHNVIKMPKMFGNVLGLDTGAVFKDYGYGKFTIADLGSNVFNSEIIINDDYYYIKKIGE